MPENTPARVGLDISAQSKAFEAELRQFDGALLELAMRDRDALLPVFVSVATVAAEALGVGRVSLWQYDRDRSEMVCSAAWHNGALVDEPMVLTRAVHPAYWHALHAARSLAVPDAARDPALAEIREEYVVRLGIGAMLDSSVCIEAEAFGIVCAETLDGPRNWTALEKQFVASIADRLGLAILLDAQRRLERQLLLARKMEAVGVMASGIAHDFNNMLSVVLASNGAARQLVAEGSDPREEFDAIDDAVRRANALTRKLIYLSRNQPVSRDEIDLDDAVQAFGETARRLMSTGVRIELRRSDAPLLIMAERTFVDQVLLNLCTNAALAMPDGGVLTFATGRLTLDRPRHAHGMLVPAGRYAHLRARDTGVGIAADVLPHVFDPFFSTRGDAGGAGLGLSVVYGGMRQHGGFVAAESVPGEGTVFHLLFPLAPDRATSA